MNTYNIGTYKLHKRNGVVMDVKMQHRPRTELDRQNCILYCIHLYIIVNMYIIRVCTQVIYIYIYIYICVCVCVCVCECVMCVYIIPCIFMGFQCHVVPISIVSIIKKL
jgi:hypothetical protein